MDIKDFIAERKYLVWWVKDPRALNEEAIVEAVLNYGDWSDVLEMIEILGIETVAVIFERESHKPRSNYRRDIAHFFNLYFARHA